MPKIVCPECLSLRIWKDGIRHTSNGGVQRYICRSCGFRFSDPSAKLKVELNIPPEPFKLLDPTSNLADVMACDTDFSVKKPFNVTSFLRSEDVASHDGSNISIKEKRLNPLDIYGRDYQESDELKRRALVALAEGAKNLAEVESREKKRAAGATEKKTDIKGKLFEFAWWMKRQGYSDVTIRCNLSALRTLANRGANIHDPESVKDVIAKQKWSGNRRKNVINAYTLFLKMNGAHWEKPKCSIEAKIPFIPTEQELDTLIAGSGRKTAVLLQLLKETAMRAGEAVKLKWTDVDFERRIITLNTPEKRSKPRIWKVSEKLMGMLKSLPKNNHRVFGGTTYDSLKQTLQLTRKRLAFKIQNPRLMKITFHTFRHWKATMLYHQTKDPYYVKEFLGHKSIKNTEVYITVERTIFADLSDDEFTVRIANKPDEIKALLEVGFEYVCEKDGMLFFRKRK